MNVMRFMHCLRRFGSIPSLSVTGAKLATGAVTITKIGADAVDGTKIADDAVDTEHIAADAIEAAHLSDGCVERAALAVYASPGASRPVPFTSWLDPDLLPLPDTPDGTILGLAGGAYGTDGPRLVGSVANANSKTETARLLWTTPPEYVAGSNLLFRFRCRVDGTAHVSQKIDLSVRKVDAEAGVGADLVVEAPQDIPTAWDLVDFTVTGASINAGDELDILLTLAVDDSGGTLNRRVEVGCVIIGCPETY